MLRGGIFCTFGHYFKAFTLFPSPSDTAILLFSRSATQESVSKPLVQKHRSEQKGVARQLIQQAVRVAKASGFPVIYLTERQQCGHDFGTRFAHAIEHVFAQGYQQVISIGNDCPELTTADLGQAAQQLTHNHFVFGPSTDGGVYLLGIRREAYHRERFLSIPWQSPQTLSTLMAQNAGQYSLLAEKADVDTPIDLKRVLRSSRIYILLKIRLLQALQECSPTLLVWHENMPQRCTLRTRPLRGPPSKAA